jgi:hypothetical protein
MRHNVLMVVTNGHVAGAGRGRLWWFSVSKNREKITNLSGIFGDFGIAYGGRYYGIILTAYMALYLHQIPANHHNSKVTGRSSQLNDFVFRRIWSQEFTLKHSSWQKERTV